MEWGDLKEDEFNFIGEGFNDNDEFNEDIKEKYNVDKDQYEWLIQ